MEGVGNVLSSMRIIPKIEKYDGSKSYIQFKYVFMYPAQMEFRGGFIHSFL